jgi:hypothetical protein
MTGQTTAPERSRFGGNVNRGRVVVGGFVVLCQALVFGLALPTMTRHGDGTPASASVPPPPSHPPTSGDAPNAASSTTGSTPGPRDQVIPQSVRWVKPSPGQATQEVPVAYADGCQVGTGSTTPVRCVYGKTNGTTTVALVGDSKVLQWLPAVQTLATNSGWRIVVYTKAACPLADATTSMGGRPYSSCVSGNTNVMRTLTGSGRPDYLITSQGAGSALNSAGKSSSDALKAGLRRTWSRLTDAAIKVIVLADNPDPRTDVYQCVAKNMTRLSRCAFSRADGIAASGAPVQRSAVAGMTGVEIADLTEWICPTTKCPPVIGNVLLYRNGSHLTTTYIKTMAGKLRAALVAAGVPRR